MIKKSQKIRCKQGSLLTNKRTAWVLTGQWEACITCIMLQNSENSIVPLESESNYNKPKYFRLLPTLLMLLVRFWKVVKDYLMPNEDLSQKDVICVVMLHESRSTQKSEWCICRLTTVVKFALDRLTLPLLELLSEPKMAVCIRMMFLTSLSRSSISPSVGFMPMALMV